jgi:hypothetical protein
MKVMSAERENEGADLLDAVERDPLFNRRIGT